MPSSTGTRPGAGLQFRRTASLLLGRTVRIDAINDLPPPTRGGRLKFRLGRGGAVRVTGWAADRTARHPVRGVRIEVDGRAFEAYYGLSRPDVVEYFGRGALRLCGFEARIPASSLGAGVHRLSAVAMDGRRRRRSRPAGGVLIELEFTEAAAARPPRAPARVLVVGPPKTGNVWLERLLAELYGLEIVTPPVYDGGRFAALREYIRLGMFPEGAVMHQHFPPAPAFFEAVAPIDCRLVTTLRHPYDAFVSLYFHVQNKRAEFVHRPDDPHALLLCRPIDHDDARRFLEQHFIHDLEKGRQWLESGRTEIVRYEDLARDTAAALRRLSRTLGPVSDARIRAAVEAASFDRMKREDTTGHLRRGVVGDWRNHLTQRHLAVFRSPRFARLIEALGYEVY